MSLTKSKTRLYFFSLLIFSIPLLAQEEYFSCNTTKGVATLGVEDNRLVYRMAGAKGNFEFSSNPPAYSKFFYNHYSRFQTDYLTISFINGEYKYSIFSNYEDNKEEQGVAVFNAKSKKEYRYNCIKTKTDNLSDLSSKLQCDKESALGCQ